MSPAGFEPTIPASRDFYLRMSEVGKRGKIGLNQPFIYEDCPESIQPF